MASLLRLLEACLTGPSWQVWGLHTVVAANLGFWVPACLLEALRVACPSWYEQHALRYGKAGPPRATKLLETQQEIPLGEQAWVSLMTTLGPHAWLNALALALVGEWLLGGSPADPWPESWAVFVLQLVALELVGDLGLYVGHRVQHEVPYLWRHYHSQHHRIGTPSAFSTAFIHPVDATLQVGVPILAAACVVRPHPTTFAVYTALRIGENVVNHSGLNAAAVNLLTLKFLPLRAGVQHHDQHHRFSNYGGQAKNFAENFWLWDWLLGTLRPLASA